MKWARNELGQPKRKTRKKRGGTRQKSAPKPSIDPVDIPEWTGPLRILGAEALELLGQNIDAWFRQSAGSRAEAVKRVH